jgi:DNA-binding MarR family transcriptional regulator
MRQAHVLLYLLRREAYGQRPPSVRELAFALGITYESAKGHILRLRQAGALEPGAPLLVRRRRVDRDAA